MTDKSIKTYVLVGTGMRGSYSFAETIHDNFKDSAKLIGVCDISPGRMAYVNELLGTDLPQYSDFDLMLKELDPDAVIICTRDYAHEEYFVKSLKADKRTFSEKPLCITAAQCRNILKANNESKAKGFVTHNMRYNPACVEIKRILRSGTIGKVLSIDFRETLDRDHGADYFRRWHRYKKNSGGLLLHKASHHFDLINWFADSKPDTLSAIGAQLFYGKNGAYHSKRCTECEHTEKCDFFNDFKENKLAQKLYFETERDNGYVRDGCVFDPTIDIEDQLSVIYRYENGISATYSLIAFASYEGMLITFEGTKGRLEYEVVHNTSWAAPTKKGEEKDYFAVSHNKNQLVIYRHGKRPEPLKIPKPEIEGGHGGADPSMRHDFFGKEWDSFTSDQMAGIEEAVQAVLVGVAANESIVSGKVVKVQDLLNDDYKEHGYE